MSDLNYEPIIDAIRTISSTFYRAGKELDCIMDKIRSEKDISYSSEALQVVVDTLVNAKLSLLITRLVRIIHINEVKK